MVIVAGHVTVEPEQRESYVAGSMVGDGGLFNGRGWVRTSDLSRVRQEAFAARIGALAANRANPCSERRFR